MSEFRKQFLYKMYLKKKAVIKELQKDINSISKIKNFDKFSMKI